MRTLRDYQEAAFQAVLAELRKVGSTLVVLPTGTGKTILFAKLATAWPNGNVLVLAHRDELIRQAQEKIGAELGYLPAVEKAQECAELECLWQGGVVIVGSVQSMCSDRRLEKFRKLPFDFIIIDEAHHAVAASYQKVIKFFQEINPGLKVLGVTATPNRADEIALGLVFQTCAFDLPIGEAIDQGWLVPIEQEYVIVEGLDFDAVRETHGQLDDGDFHAADLEQVLIEEKPLHAMAEPVLTKCGDRQAIIFTAGVAHAHLFASVLNRHKPDSAVAVDGETPHGERKDIVRRFKEGRIQYLTNFGIATEGFDAPPASVVVMGRPTKSLGLYVQMLGRGMRPLDGLVDGLPTAEARRAAIAGSAKPSMLALDFVGNSRHKIVSAVDVLGGKYDVEVQELAKRMIRRRPMNVNEALERARARMLLLREERARQSIRAKVSWQSERVDPFGFGPAPGGKSVEQTRGGCTDAQIAFLVNLGVPYETAARYTKRQAGAVITKLKSERCTKKQRAILVRHGFDPDVNFDRAKAIIDEIAASGWKLRNLAGVG